MYKKFIERKFKKANFFKGVPVVVFSLLFIIALSSNFSVFSETPSPDANTTSQITPTAEDDSTTSPSEITPTAGQTEENSPSTETTPTATLTPTPTITPTIAPSIAPTISPTIEPTATEELDYLYDFTVPPYREDEKPSETLSPDSTISPGLSDATIDIVEVENIERKKEFRWSDIIKYLAYGFFILAGIAILYGIVCLFTLIFFKKDITMAGLKKNKNKNKKDKK